MSRVFGVAALCIALGGCLPHSPAREPASAAPEMRPEQFFAGRTEGRGRLTLRGRDARPFHVTSVGANEPDGGFRVEQTVAYDDGEIARRTWRIRPIDARTYTGSLSDAVGEMHATIEGNVLHLRYLVRHPGVYMEQWLYLQSDGRTVANQGEVTVLGIPWGTLEERIVRQ